MSLYQKQLASFLEFKRSLLDGAPAQAEWETFEALCRVGKEAPAHMKLIETDLAKLNAVSKDAAAILDHGSGKGFMVCYLIANGYTSSRGMDVNPKHAEFYQLANVFFRSSRAFNEDVFFMTDGSLSPFPDDYFDYVYSNQVLEHVPNAVLGLFFDEEARVLKNNGYVRHSFPHKNCLNDTHTRTWFLSLLLPQSTFKWVVATASPKLRKRVYELLFLRPPSTYKRMMRSAFGTVEDETMARLRILPDLESYEGNKWLRKQVNNLITMPVIGAAVTFILSEFTIKDLTSRNILMAK